MPASALRLVVVVLTVSACVSVADGPSPTEPHPTTTTVPPTTTTTLTLEDGLTSFRECLTDAGVLIDEVELNGRGRPQLAWAMADLDLTDRLVVAALGDCAPRLAAGALDLAPDPELRGLVMASLIEFASCLRANGVPDFPDPSPMFTGVGSPFADRLIPWTDDDLATAVIICNRALASRS
ncbi:MAG TPA: hypothetical protein VF115_13310 [Acidimicrobiia bacterium]